MSDAAIEIRGLRVLRGGKLVLHSLDADVAAGRITGLLGPSGGGKSTLMRAIVGVQRVESGGVTVLGEPAGSPPLRTRVGYVTQAPSVYSDLTAHENLDFFRRVIGPGAAEIGETLRTVGMEAEAGQLVGTMSGGQRARISLATALLGRPRLLVLDEPTVGLDPLLRERLWQTFSDLAAAGTTLLVSSHVMDEAERCDELLLLRDGELLATGTPETMRNRTGAATVGDAFLRMIKERAAVEAEGTKGTEGAGP
jgi:ABC-2 type transport system ATP-binding protein